MKRQSADSPVRMFRRRAMNTEWVPVRVETKQLALRAPISWVRTLDDWRRQQPDLPTRPEAMRRLVELGLKVKGK
jgi:Fe2+ transport system protein FeoA